MVKCGNCVGCKKHFRDNCGICDPCLKPKLKKKCVERVCVLNRKYQVDVTPFIEDILDQAKSVPLVPKAENIFLDSIQKPVLHDLREICDDYFEERICGGLLNREGFSADHNLSHFIMRVRELANKVRSEDLRTKGTEAS